MMTSEREKMEASWMNGLSDSHFINERNERGVGVGTMDPPCTNAQREKGTCELPKQTDKVIRSTSQTGRQTASAEHCL